MNKPKCILLSNDDGFDAQGIKALEKSLAGLGELWKISPDSEQSGSSHALNFHHALTLIQVSDQSFRLKNAYPADCINVGLHAKGFPNFDLVVSGINHGPNLGDDVHYSGTVAAARQGALHKVPAIAISACDSGAAYSQMLRIGSWLHSWLQENYSRLQQRITYNMNYPYETAHTETNTSYPNVSYTYQGQRIYKDCYLDLERNGNTRVLKLLPTEMDHVPEENSDLEAVRDGFISITPLSTYTTHIDEIHRWTKRNHINK